MLFRSASIVLLASATASAQVAWAPPPGSFPVVLRSTDPEATFTLSKEKSSPPFAQCSGECVVPLMAGSYFLKVEESKRLVGGRKRFNIERASEVNFEPRTFEDRSSGVLMGSIGIGLLVLGATGMIAAGIPMGESQEKDDSNQAIFALSFCGFIAGAAFTPIGWVAAGRSSPSVRVTPLAPH